MEGHIRDLAFTVDRHGSTKLAPEGLYGRRKITALTRRSIPGVSRGDKSLMESIIGLFKTECIRTDVLHEGPYRQLADVDFANAGWVDWWNNRRLHGTLENLTPVE